MNARASVLVACGLVALLACRAKDAPAPSAVVTAAPAPSASASASSPPELRPEPLQESSVQGLHVRSGTLQGQPGWGFSELSVDLAKIKLDIVATGRGEPLGKLLPEHALAVINGGYFEADFRPSTWLVRDRVELGKKSDTAKGGLLALRAKDLYVGPFSGLSFEPELAVQSFPLVVETDGSSGIHSDDGRRAARTIVCTTKSGLHFVVIAAPRGDGPTLFETAGLLRKPWPDGFGCGAALNLDGGPSSGVWFAPAVGAKQRLPAAPVAYGIALLPR